MLWSSAYAIDVLFEQSMVAVVMYTLYFCAGGPAPSEGPGPAKRTSRAAASAASAGGIGVGTGGEGPRAVAVDRRLFVVWWAATACLVEAYRTVAFTHYTSCSSSSFKLVTSILSSACAQYKTHLLYLQCGLVAMACVVATHMCVWLGLVERANIAEQVTAVWSAVQVVDRIRQSLGY